MADGLGEEKILGGGQLQVEALTLTERQRNTRRLSHGTIIRESRIKNRFDKAKQQMTETNKMEDVSEKARSEKDEEEDDEEDFDQD